MASFIKNLEWRRAVKKFGTEGPAPDVSLILKAAANAPTCFGFQPYKVVVVTDEETKKALHPVAWNQPQVLQCSHLLVFCARTDTPTRAEELIKAMGVEGSPVAESIRGVGATYSDPDKALAWAAKQTYIAMGFALAAAAELEIASCPMEGFSPDGFADVLKLPANLKPVSIMAVGRTDTETNGGVFPRFRFPQDELIEEFAPQKNETIQA